MTLTFPDAATLRRVLEDGVPADLAATPVQVDLSGPTIALDPTVALPRKLSAHLNALGVGRSRVKLKTGTPRANWFGALPLEKTTFQSHTHAILCIPSAVTSAWVADIVQMGGHPTVSWDGPEGHAIVEVRDCPCHILTRAEDRIDDVRGYVESQPNVWLEVGHTHDYAEHLAPETGIGLIAAPFDLNVIERPAEPAPVEFVLPPMPLSWTSRPIPAELAVRIALRLKPGAEYPACFWVMPPDALQHLLSETATELLKGLVVAPTGDGRRVVWATRKDCATFLFEGADAYTSHRGINTLYLPVSRQLQPPMRRSVLQEALIPENGQLVWLESRENGTFQPFSIPKSAFVPLEGLADYSTEASVAVATHTIAACFEFLPMYVVDESETPAAPTVQKPTAPPAKPVKPVAVPPPTPRPKKIAASVAIPEVDDRQAHLAELEERMLAIPGGPESPDRAPLWRPLARAYAALGRTADAAICWINALWSNGLDDETVQEWHGAEEDNHPPSPRRLFAYELTDQDLTIVDEVFPRARKDCRAKDDVTIQILEREEAHVPIKAVWLAARRMMQRQGDVLGLVRVRDRLLRRLFSGLSPIRDVPPTVRRLTGHGSDAQGRLGELADAVDTWLSKSVNGPFYAHCYLAYLSAKLGDRDRAEQRIAKIENDLLSSHKPANPAVATSRQILGEAFHERTQQALGLRPESPTLSEQAMAEIAAIRKTIDTHRGGRNRSDELIYKQAFSADYAIGTLREISRVLEPQTRVSNAAMTLDRGDAISTELTELGNSLDAERIRTRTEHLLTSTQDTFRILNRMLPVAPRVDDAYARLLLGQVLARPVAVSQSSGARIDCRSECGMLGRALAAAGHFGLTDTCRELTRRLMAWAASVDSRTRILVIAGVCGPSFRALRRYGLTELIVPMLETFSLALDSASGARVLQARAAIAGGWLGVGYHDQGLTLVEQVSAALSSDDLKVRPDVHTYADVAAEYIAAVGLLPDPCGRILQLLRTIPKDAIYRGTGPVDHFSANHLLIVDALTVTLADSSAHDGPGVRDWIDQEEYLIRRQIHADVATMLAASGH